MINSLRGSHPDHQAPPSICVQRTQRRLSTPWACTLGGGVVVSDESCSGQPERMVGLSSHKLALLDVTEDALTSSRALFHLTSPRMN